MSFTVSPFDPDSVFDMCALSKLEAAGVEVVTSLYKVYKQFAIAAGLSVDLKHHQVESAEKCVDVLIQQWLDGGWNPQPPTWRLLFNILRTLNLEELSEQIREYFTSEWSNTSLITLCFDAV